MSLSVQKIRQRGRSDPQPQASPSTTRTRAQTLENAVYDDTYKQCIREAFATDGPKKEPWEIPDNVTSPDAITDTMIRNAFFYAHYRVKYRKVTPRSLEFLEKYRETAAAAMKAPSTDKKIKLAALNEILHSKVILFKQPSKEELEGQAAVKELIQFRYYADYGDYMAENCKRFRDAAMERKVEGFQCFTGSGENWTVIQKRIEREDERYKEWSDQGKPGGVAPEQPTIDAIEKACNELKLDHDNTRFSIRWYSHRNEEMHCKVNIHIQQCDWNALATQLWKDIRELPNVFGDEEYRHMQKALDTIKDRYFAELDPVNPTHSEKALNLSIAKLRKAKAKLAQERNARQVSTSGRNRRE
ncbi:hypothetical protein OEA41_007908 [Lepraria neglecta]|uniref:Uncharacterized protein n=1 Tax=Lepraria neglecta TaxID=209136 RepID=A0AAD9ZEF7_9LECA|nr:hypothetical protein OEA41_007908 [Lepraria neglecta]